MSTSFDRPYIDVVYKLSGKVENRVFVPAMKLSKGKITLPGKKQLFRLKDTEGNYAKDVIGLSNEKVDGEPILAKAMENGSIVFRLPSLEEIRENALRNLSQLPSMYKKLRNAPLYPVELSFQLRKIKEALTDQLRCRECLP